MVKPNKVESFEHDNAVMAAYQKYLNQGFPHRTAMARALDEAKKDDKKE